MEDYCVVKQKYFVIIFDFVAMENFVFMQDYYVAMQDKFVVIFDVVAML